MRTDKVRIAICQFDSHQPTAASCSPESLEPSPSFAEHEIKNLAKAKEFIARAVHDRADLIIFPEYFITGVIEDHLHLASKESKWIKEFQSLAIEHQIDIIPGTIVEEAEQEEAVDRRDLFNSAYYVDKSGQILGKYRKKNLWHALVLDSYTFCFSQIPSHTCLSISDPRP
ncbi:hypothetical protein PTTG_29325 [Puccinia triticina 1-1 BBBD Race 1]|uniref:CN hydrolase domain-containing protein n=1 Tax=Puccinia triticina (isolate 1-1 / race 1 (BBBD)) TaxID=630390 RepID=A0A180G4U4_PUCT1|nr:hypothetical protein PTTG_29325 [Puccinia triticina 1-1 BBBD Race 1]WAR57810.1 hypothetical protein PtB15_5B40 [Puccinia triticina]